MADLRPPSRADDRGQLLLIAAFIIATSFVVLALVVNSAIFTENLATRDDVPGSQDALQQRHEIEQSVGDAVERINRDDPITPTNRDDMVDSIDVQGGIQQSTRGRVVNVEYVSWDSGTKIAQDEPRNFSNADPGAADWTVVAGVERTRNFRLNLTDYGELVNPSNAFKIVVNGSNDKLWNLTIAEASGDNVSLQVDRDGVSTKSCTREFEDSMEIDLTAGLVDGRSCFAMDRDSSGTPLWFASGVDKPYKITYENVDKIKGTYSFVVDDPGTVGIAAVGADQPYSDPSAIYNLTVRYSYHTTNVGYETLIRVAPGEVPP